MNFHAVKCRHLVVSAAKTLYENRFQERCIFPHKLEQCMKSLLELVWKITVKFEFTHPVKQTLYCFNVRGSFEIPVFEVMRASCILISHGLSTR